ncbi:hypothetical protein GGR57DRAFT_460281 [Xylariaceae sp. FL1272]|nr:hypothetical protein GGR57DRAFT_460281 [Xylariaceae sp. FL1272]
MPRTTRRSASAAQAIAAAEAQNEQEAIQQQLEHTSTRKTNAPSITDDENVLTVVKRGRGRPSKLIVTTASPAGPSESVSSAPTPITISSDAEYSTPATSNAVTPAPSSKSTAEPQEAASRPRRRRLVVELPPLPPDDGSSGSLNPKPQTRSTAGRSTRRSITCPSYPVDSDEDDELLDPGQSRSIALARRLQQEEDSKVYDADQSAADLDLARRLQDEEYESSAPYIGGPDRHNSGTARNKRKAGPSSDAKSSAGSKKKAVFVVSDSEEMEEPDEETEDDIPLRHRKKQKVSSKKGKQVATPSASARPKAVIDDSQAESDFSLSSLSDDWAASSASDTDGDATNNDPNGSTNMDRFGQRHPRTIQERQNRRQAKDRADLIKHHPELLTMWQELENMPVLTPVKANQPTNITLELKPFQLEGLAWMTRMEQTKWKGGLLGDEMGLGKTIQAVSLIMSDYPAKTPTLVLLPPVALGQWQDEIASYTNNQLKTIVFHGTNSKAKKLSLRELKKFDVIIMSYNSLEAMYRRQEKGTKKKEVLCKERSLIHQIKFHRVILDEAHCIKTRSTMTARACFALLSEYRWCLSGTPLQNRIGELFSLVRFLNITPFASYACKRCPCIFLEWGHGVTDGRCNHCPHSSPSHVSLFNQELLNPIQKYGNVGPGKEAFGKLRLLTDRIMLRRLKKNHTNAMELPVKEILIDRQFFGEEENDLASSIMTSTERQFDTYVAQGVVLNNYANIFGLIMQMRQVADHPDLILKKSSEGGQNVMVCCICDEPAEEAIQSKCKHEFCRECVRSYLASQDDGGADCPRCHIPLSIDLEQPSIEQDEMLVKKSSIINRIKMENWTSSTKIELLVHQLHRLRSDKASHKSIIFSQFTTMLQLIEWRLRRAGITTVMLDGSMTPAQRQASIKAFMENTEVECFLVSLKAGGVALNLTEASHVFIVDPWWNPAAEWQSADRCHRIGQTRPCTITRLCIEDSVESRMVLLQEKKTNMINSTINSDDAAMEALTLEDLSFLFRGT